MKFLLIFLVIGYIGQIKNECHLGSVNFVRTSNVRPLDTVLDKIKQKLQISSLRCHQKCIDSSNCVSYFYDSNALNCYLITNENLRINHQNLFRAPGWNYHRRICLSSDSICTQQWAFESYGSSQFNSIADKIITNLNSEEICLNACSNEKQFICRSAVYDHANKTCSLHSNNRNMAPELFEQNFDSHLLYMENLCVQQGCEIWRTHFELILSAQLVDSKSFKQTFNLQPEECIELCKKDLVCKSLNVDYSSGKCEYFDELNTLNKNQEDNGHLVQQYNTFYKKNQFNDKHNAKLILNTSSNGQTVEKDYQQNDFNLNKNKLILNSNVNYFVKICLTELNSCGTDWTFERLIGKQLDVIGDKYLDEDYVSEKLIQNVTIREQCLSFCLRTMNSDYKNRSQHTKESAFVCRSLNYNAKTGHCKLLSYNQHTTFGKLLHLVDKENVEYIESNCILEPKGFCNWKTTHEKKLILADRVTVETNLTVCKEKCLNLNSFTCRSFSFDSKTQKCSLSHHSSYSLPKNNSLQHSSSSIYMELATCFKVNVECKGTEMIAHVHSNMPFKGRIYARGNSKNCSSDVNDSLHFDLPISLNQSICGTVLQVENEFSNILVIQGNDQVLTSLDKVIGVKCSYNVNSITGEAVLFINDLPLTDRGRSVASLPDLSLHVMDMNGMDRQEVNLGELLRVQVRISDEDTYGIFVRNLIAKDEFGMNNLTLIDKVGCPVQIKMMREIKRINSNTKQLESYFEAFSFTGSTQLQLEAEVETCLNSCRPVQCQVINGRSNDDYEMVVSYGRRKREYNILDSKVLSQYLRIKIPEFEETNFNQAIEKDELESKDVSKYSDSNKAKQSVPSPASKASSSKFNFIVNKVGQFCFEVNLLAVLSSLTLLIQCVFFSIAIIIFYYKKNQK